MATIEKLCTNSLVLEVKDVLGRRQMPERKIYLRPGAAQWMRETLPSLKVDGYVEGAISPNQQALQLFKDFISGEDMFSLDYIPKPLKPYEVQHGIWELRTPDLRFFGWFCRKAVFVISFVETKSELLKNSSYSYFRNQSVKFRESLELDEPRVIIGGRDDVF